MKLKRSLRIVTTFKDGSKEKDEKKALVHNFVALSACATLAMILGIGTKVADPGERSQVYAASDEKDLDQDTGIDWGSMGYDLPTGIAGMVTSVADTPAAGTEDIKGRVLVANVIMNRISNDEFPDTVTDVVWDQRYGVPQFSPTYDGKIYEVTVTDETKEAVKQALEGVDYSEGALFFIQRSAAEKHNVNWFDKDLKRLFKYGVHEFYTYPDEGDEQTADTVSLSETGTVQMVKK